VLFHPIEFGLEDRDPVLRVEIRLLLEEMLPRITDWQVDGPVERLRSNFIGGIKHLPMTISTR
jgi:hypothetical protein